MRYMYQRSDILMVMLRCVDNHAWRACVSMALGEGDAADDLMCDDCITQITDGVTDSTDAYA